MYSETQCPIWLTPANNWRDELKHGGSTFSDSPRAGGHFEIRDLASSHLTPDIRPRLTTWLIDERTAGVNCPVVTREVLQKIALRQPLSVPERTNRLLKALGRLTPEAGGWVTFSNANVDERPVYYLLLAHSEGAQDVQAGDLYFLLESLHEQNLITFSQRVETASMHAKVTYGGYAHLAELEKLHPISSQGFVAMWFDPQMNEAYDKGLEPAISAAGYKPLCIKYEHFVGDIVDKIISEIRRSRFVVADLTYADEPRCSVYYEAGFAHGLGLPVIFTCHRGKANETHFDINHHNCIRWETPEELFDALRSRISSAIGWGPEKPSA